MTSKRVAKEASRELRKGTGPKKEVRSVGGSALRQTKKNPRIRRVK